MRLPHYLVTASICSFAFAAIGPSTNLHIVNKIIAPDGFNRSTVLAGATAASASMPGPVITGRKGDTLRINVIDELQDTNMLTTTSIHWHGIFQEGTNWADGPSGVTQCPIVPGHSFLYQFTVTDQAGTFWYHSHHSTQYCDGLRGPLVLYDPDDPLQCLYDIDDESTIITLADCTPLSVINVKHNKCYRFRLISISCDPNFTFTIDNHTMTIIEVDGVLSKPSPVDSIQIFVGQRYSFVLTTNQTVGNYWIRAIPGLDPTLNGSAILRYAGAPIADPTTNPTASVNPLLETNLQPLHNPGAPGKPVQGGVDVNLNLNFQFNSTVPGRFIVNGVTFRPPSVPALLQILSGARTAQELLPPNKVVELSMNGGITGGPQTFDIVRSAGSSIYDYQHPVRRDVVNIGELNDNVTIRFSTYNPGPWFLHCHIDWHLNLGFAIIFVTDVQATSQINPPASWDQLCPIYNSSGLP
ncbi:laccase 1 [Amanita muscaria]